jgi:hypothetical protein
VIAGSNVLNRVNLENVFGIQVYRSSEKLLRHSTPPVVGVVGFDNTANDLTAILYFTQGSKMLKLSPQ